MFFSKQHSGAPKWIVVFLGNPGFRYSGTRHNAGFMTADEAEKRYNVKIDRVKFKALTAVLQIGGEKVLFMKPQTYMNLSGDSVSQAMKFYKIPIENILVVSDDTSLPTGKLRIRRSGSAGGHNGLKDIISKCGSEGFPRIKIGVGIKPGNYDMADWVLGSFSPQDAAVVNEAAKMAALAISVIITEGIDTAMNQFN